MSWMRPGHGLDLSHSLFYLSLLLWVRRINGLADFSSKMNYLSRIITSHSTHACDGQPLRLHCPRHSTISIQSAFYGSGEARLCQKPESSHPHRNHSCSAFTALQKLLSECQSHRHCQLSVNHLLFGKDPCPGTTKYLHVDYKCKPTEHKRHVACDGESLVLRCKPPKVLNVYAAVYGRGLGQSHTCPSNKTLPHSFECLNHEVVHFVSKSCYNKQKCAVVVSNKTFRDPCFPGTRKYLSVLYSCVPQSLLREADPSIFKSTSPPPVDKKEDEPDVFPKDSRRPEASGVVMSDSLSTYVYIKEHSEMAALLFTSSVCVGLLLTLLALSIRVTCWCHRTRDHTPKRERPVKKQEEEEVSDDEDETGSSLVSEGERKTVVGWEEVAFVSEAAERAERIERRDMIIQEIWMNAYLNGGSCEAL